MTRLRRFLLGLVGTALVLVASYSVWVVGLGQFDDDYCIVLAEAPDGEISYSAPEWEFPLTYRCDYGPGGVVTVNEPVPVVATAALGGVTLLAVSAIWWWLATHPARRARKRKRKDRRSARAEYEGKHRA